MKILTVVDPQIPLSKMHHVGATMLPYDLCKSLSYKEDIDMSILVHNDLGIDSLDNVKIVDLGEPKARYQQQVARKIEEIIDDYDLVHIHISTPGFSKYLVSFSKENQWKIIYTMHTWTNSLAVSYYYADSFKKLVEDAEINIVFLTHSQSDALLKGVGLEEFYKPERIFYIENAVNIEYPDYIYLKKERAIAVGRMVESKGIDKIVKACIEANQELLLVSPSWRMTPKEQKYRDKVLALIDEAPEGLITLSEGLPHEELIKEIECSKFGILYSTFDVFSLFILECVNLKVPVLALDSGSTSEVCDILEDCGVNKFKKLKDLVNMIKFNNYKKFSGPIPEDCTYSKFIDNYYNLYKEVLKRNQAR